MRPSWQPVHMGERVGGKQSDHESALHIENPRPECPASTNAKRHPFDRAHFVDGVQMAEHENPVRGGAGLVRGARRPGDPQVIPRLSPGQIFDLCSALPPFRRDCAPQTVNGLLIVRGRFAAHEAFE